MASRTMAEYLIGFAERSIVQYQLAALQKKVAYVMPTSAKLAEMKPNRPCLANRATSSARVTALRTSTR